MILHTNLKHIESEEQYHQVLADNENVMICCGRMGPMCIPVYQSIIGLEPGYQNFAFDHPQANVLRSLPESQGFMGLPFTIYYKNGKVAAATSGLQTREQVQEVLDREFG